MLILSWFLTFYILEDGERGWQWSLRSLSASQRIRLLDAGRNVLADLGSYLRWAAGTSVAMATVAAVALTLTSTPLAGALSMLVLVAGMVPYYGPVFAVGLVGLIALVDHGPIVAIAMAGSVAPARYGASRVIDAIRPADSGRVGARSAPRSASSRSPSPPSGSGSSACSSPSRR